MAGETFIGPFTVDELKALTLPQVALLAAGRCPFCEREVRDWKAPTGSFAPEAWAGLRDRAVDPATGHMEKCARKVRI